MKNWVGIAALVIFLALAVGLVHAAFIKFPFPVHNDISVEVLPKTVCLGYPVNIYAYVTVNTTYVAEITTPVGNTVTLFMKEKGTTPSRIVFWTTYTPTVLGTYNVRVRAYFGGWYSGYVTFSVVKCPISKIPY